jgi:hypothetical protein
VDDVHRPIADGSPATPPAWQHAGTRSADAGTRPRHDAHNLVSSPRRSVRMRILYGVDRHSGGTDVLVEPKYISKHSRQRFAFAVASSINQTQAIIKSSKFLNAGTDCQWTPSSSASDACHPESAVAG